MYKPQFDGVRAICIVFTICNHVHHHAFWINGTVGVDIFFALSGWLITFLLLDELQKQNNINIKGFYIRRFFRIAPLYFTTILIYFVLSTIQFFFHYPEKLSEFMSVFIYLVSFNSEYRPDPSVHVFGHAWTLGIEEKFYIIWPFMILLWLRFPLLSIILGILSISWLFYIGIDYEYLSRGYIGLSFGAIMALIANKNQIFEDNLKNKSMVFPLFGAIFAIYVASILMPNPILWNVAISFFSSIAIANMWLYDNQAINRILSFRPLARIGELTFGIYLIQSIVIGFVEGVLAKIHIHNGLISFLFSYLICILVALALRKYIEAPCIAFGKSIALAPASRHQDVKVQP